MISIKKLDSIVYKTEMWERVANQCLLLGDFEFSIFVNIVVTKFNSGVIDGDLGGTAKFLLQKIVGATEKDIFALNGLCGRGTYSDKFVFTVSFGR